MATEPKMLHKRCAQQPFGERCASMRLVKIRVFEMSSTSEFLARTCQTIVWLSND